MERRKEEQREQKNQVFRFAKEIPFPSPNLTEKASKLSSFFLLRGRDAAAAAAAAKEEEEFQEKKQYSRGRSRRGGKPSKIR